MKYYFIKDDLFAKTKEQIIQYMVENSLSELTAYKAKRITVNDFFFCKINGIAEKDNMTCGVKWCSLYSPKNGKSGCCKHFGSLYDKGEAIIFYNSP